MSIFRLGFVTMFLSEPLVSGYTTGAAFHVFTSQVRSIFGIHAPHFKNPASIFKVSSVACLSSYCHVFLFSPEWTSRVVISFRSLYCPDYLGRGEGWEWRRFPQILFVSCVHDCCMFGDPFAVSNNLVNTLCFICAGACMHACPLCACVLACVCVCVCMRVRVHSCAFSHFFFISSLFFMCACVRAFVRVRVRYPPPLFPPIRITDLYLHIQAHLLHQCWCSADRSHIWRCPLHSQVLQSPNTEEDQVPSARRAANCEFCRRSISAYCGDGWRISPNCGWVDWRGGQTDRQTDRQNLCITLLLKHFNSDI